METEGVPSDATVVGTTWAKCNKDGSPDRRFANNRQIPIAGYGEIRLASPRGLNEEYMFSSAEKAERFTRALTEYQKALRVLAATSATTKTVAVPAASGPKSAPTFQMTAVRLLEVSSAASAKQAIEILEQFVVQFKKDGESFSGSRSPVELEAFINQLASVPELIRSFFRRTPSAKSLEANFLKGTKDMIRGVLAQVRGTIERADDSSAEFRALLPMLVQAEKALR